MFIYYEGAVEVLLCQLVSSISETIHPERSWPYTRCGRDSWSFSRANLWATTTRMKSRTALRRLSV